MDTQAAIENLRHEVWQLRDRVRHLEDVRHFNLPWETVTPLWESLLRAVDGRSFQQFFREVDGRDLSIALIGLPADLFAKIRENMTSNAWKETKEQMALEWHHWPEIVAARRKMLWLLRRLKEMGEIVVVRSSLPKDLEGVWEGLSAHEPYDHDAKSKELSAWRSEILGKLD